MEHSFQHFVTVLALHGYASREWPCAPTPLRCEKGQSGKMWEEIVPRREYASLLPSPHLGQQYNSRLPWAQILADDPAMKRDKSCFRNHLECEDLRQSIGGWSCWKTLVVPRTLHLPSFKEGGMLRRKWNLPHSYDMAIPHTLESYVFKRIQTP
jgi:hypothetical protein